MNLHRGNDASETGGVSGGGTLPRDRTTAEDGKDTDTAGRRDDAGRKDTGGSTAATGTRDRSEEKESRDPALTDGARPLGDGAPQRTAAQPQAPATAEPARETPQRPTGLPKAGSDGRPDQDKRTDRTQQVGRAERADESKQAERAAGADRIAGADRAGKVSAGSPTGRDTRTGTAAGTTRTDHLDTARTAKAGADGDRAADIDRLTQRMDSAVGDFVDDPQRAVREADAVLDEAASLIERRRKQLRQEWDGGRDTDTEKLRVALTHYRDLTRQLIDLTTAS
jgi:hypothetical protein